MLVDDEMRQRLEDIFNEKCVVTLSQINGELKRRVPAEPLCMTGPLLKVWKEGCFALNWVGPFQQRETDVLFCKEAKIWKLVHQPSHYAPLCFYR